MFYAQGDVETAAANVLDIAALRTSEQTLFALALWLGLQPRYSNVSMLFSGIVLSFPITLHLAVISLINLRHKKH